MLGLQLFFVTVPKVLYISLRCQRTFDSCSGFNRNEKPLVPQLAYYVGGFSQHHAVCRLYQVFQYWHGVTHSFSAFYPVRKFAYQSVISNQTTNHQSLSLPYQPVALTSWVHLRFELTYHVDIYLPPVIRQLLLNMCRQGRMREPNDIRSIIIGLFFNGSVFLRNRFTYTEPKSRSPKCLR
jgi:hypothetical protein